MNTLFSRLIDHRRYNESLDEYSFRDKPNGRDRYPDAVQVRCTILLNHLVTMKCDAWWWMQGLLVPKSKNGLVRNDAFSDLVCWLQVLPGGSPPDVFWKRLMEWCGWLWSPRVLDLWS